MPTAPLPKTCSRCHGAGKIEQDFEGREPLCAMDIVPCPVCTARPAAATPADEIARLRTALTQVMALMEAPPHADRDVAVRRAAREAIAHGAAFGPRLRGLRERYGRSVADLAECLRGSAAWLEEVEGGTKAPPDTADLTRACEFLNTRVSEWKQLVQAAEQDRGRYG